MEDAGIGAYVMQRRQRIAVIGGGWAGMAAAVTLVQRGHFVCVFEAARNWGGRARALEIRAPHGDIWTVDNGQHLLIGAYSECLRLMRAVGVNVEQALLRHPLDLRDVHGQGLHLPQLPVPWNVLYGIFATRGWIGRDKVALLLRAMRWQRQRFGCLPDATVADLCQGLPPRVMQTLIEPLCVSALNLPASDACGSVFLRVLQDSLFGAAGGSDLLIPRVDMGQLFPTTAAGWLEQQGAHLRLGQRVQSIQCCSQFDSTQPSAWSVDGEVFDAVILATHSAEAARLVDDIGNVGRAWATCAGTLAHTAIATIYAWTPTNDLVLPAPMVALHPTACAPAQFAFDRSQLAGPPGLLALVVSASHGSRDVLQKQVIAQAQQQLGLPALQPLKTVADKRATFSCTPSVQRPAAQITAGIWACGDYVQGPYPATLEGAVRSGVQAAYAALGQLTRSTEQCCRPMVLKTPEVSI